jgi:protein-disulfide isomerase
MSISSVLPALMASALALSACDKVDKAFDERVHAYLLAHPEVIQEAIDKLQAKQDAQAAALAKQAIVQNRQAIERDPRDFVANPDGKITVTEFYDYRCPHCVNAAPAVLSIIHDSPDVRFVFKEFPIFGPVSEKAAAGAIAVKRAGGDYLGVYRDYMAARPLDEAAIDRTIRAHGVDPDSLKPAALPADIAAQLLSVRRLAMDLAIDGTPAFIIGSSNTESALSLEHLQALVAAARKEQG